ncbi:hypothetical protein SAMN05720354_10489 [Nitrosospira sp. Nsp1]|nr:hypothetical protein SAMN05720354_10489 [Nitrosospira sp. Nsp1]
MVHLLLYKLLIYNSYYIAAELGANQGIRGLNPKSHNKGLGMLPNP